MCTEHIKKGTGGKLIIFSKFVTNIVLTEKRAGTA